MVAQGRYINGPRDPGGDSAVGLLTNNLTAVIHDHGRTAKRVNGCF